MLALGLGLGLAAGRLLDLSPTLAIAAPLAAVASAFAMTGLATGMGAAHPRFQFTNPNELAMTPGAIAYMALALAYAALTTLGQLHSVLTEMLAEGKSEDMPVRMRVLPKEPNIIADPPAAEIQDIWYASGEDVIYLDEAGV